MKILGGLIITLCLISSAGYAQTAGCPARKDSPVVNIKYLDSGVIYNSGLTSPQMQAVMSQTSTVTPDMMNTALNGLTVSHLTLTTNSNVAFITLGNRICAYPSSIEITMGFKEPQVVYIKNKYPDGTCQKDAILQHENGHVTINQNTAQALAFAVRQDMENLINDPGYPFPVASKEAGVEAISALINQHVSADWSQAKSQNQGLNGQLDTPENYRATTKLCASW